MAKLPGSPKTGGRKKGTPNKVTQDVRDIIEGALGQTLPERIIHRIQNVSPSHEISVLMGLMEYCYPKRKALEVSGELEVNNNQSNVEDLALEVLEDAANTKDSGGENSVQSSLPEASIPTKPLPHS